MFLFFFCLNCILCPLPRCLFLRMYAWRFNFRKQKFVRHRLIYLVGVEELHARKRSRIKNFIVSFRFESEKWARKVALDCCKLILFFLTQSSIGACGLVKTTVRFTPLTGAVDDRRESDIWYLLLLLCFLFNSSSFAYIESANVQCTHRVTGCAAWTSAICLDTCSNGHCTMYMNIACTV